MRVDVSSVYKFKTNKTCHQRIANKQPDTAVGIIRYVTVDYLQRLNITTAKPDFSSTV